MDKIRQSNGGNIELVELPVLNEIRERTERLIRSIRVRRCEVPFVILFSERSGSSHLCSMLDNHPEIVCRYEDFNEEIVSEQHPPPAEAELIRLGVTTCFRRLNDFQHTSKTNPTRNQVVQHFHNIYACPKKACGFKYKFRIQLELFPEVLKELASLKPNLHVIALQRDNVIKQAISRQNMLRIRAVGKQKKCNLTDDFSPEFDQPFQVNVAAVLKYARFVASQKDAFFNSVRELENKNAVPALHLTYEELLSDRESTARRVFDYLKVDPDAPIYSTVHKATADDLSSVIENFDELIEAVKGTAFESMI